MACGTPVLAYATGGIPEIIGADECAGRLVGADDEQALANALIATLADPRGAHQMAAASLTRVRNLFDPQQAAERYMRLFQQLIAGSAGAAVR
jgi:glycosyltransferase involved in cell wall biosynthesis